MSSSWSKHAPQSSRLDARLGSGSQLSSLAPGLLVAAPPLGDPHFERRVVLLVDHGREEGAFGWVINGDPLMTMSELLERADACSAAPADVPGIVRSGGPVGPEQVWLLYPTAQKRDDQPDQFDVGFGITATSSRRLLEGLLEGYRPTPLLGLAGYAGWAPSQLEDEIRLGAWLPTDIDPNLIFEQDPAAVWLRAYERVGTSAIAFTSKTIGSA